MLEDDDDHGGEEGGAEVRVTCNSSAEVQVPGMTKGDNIGIIIILNDPQPRTQYCCRSTLTKLFHSRYSNSLGHAAQGGCGNGPGTRE